MAKHESAETRAEKITNAANAAAEGSDSLFDFLETHGKNKVEVTEPGGHCAACKVTPAPDK